MGIVSWIRSDYLPPRAVPPRPRDLSWLEGLWLRDDPLMRDAVEREKVYMSVRAYTHRASG